MILDNDDQKIFNLYSKINFPPIEQLAEIMKNKDIKEEDFDCYSHVNYLLFRKRNEFSSFQRQIIIENIPLKKINNFFANNQSFAFKNDSNPLFYFSSSPSPSIPFSQKRINTLSMILNIITLSIQNDEDMNKFFEKFGKEEIIFFIDNMCFLLENMNNIRLHRKIFGFLAKLFMYNDDMIFKYLRTIERIIRVNNTKTNIITKIQQIIKTKQKNYINLIVGKKNEIEIKIKNNDTYTIDHICSILVLLIGLIPKLLLFSF